MLYIHLIGVMLTIDEKSSDVGCFRQKHSEFAIPVLRQEPNQLLWQSLHMADTMTLLSRWRWKRPDSYENGHGKEAVIKHEVLTLVVTVIVAVRGPQIGRTWRVKHGVNMCRPCWNGAATLWGMCCSLRMQHTLNGDRIFSAHAKIIWDKWLWCLLWSCSLAD